MPWTELAHLICDATHTANKCRSIIIIFPFIFANVVFHLEFCSRKQTKNKNNIIIVMTFRCVVMKYIIYSIYLRASVVPMERKPLHLVRCVKLHGNMCVCVCDEQHWAFASNVIHNIHLIRGCGFIVYTLVFLFSLSAVLVWSVAAAAATVALYKTCKLLTETVNCFTNDIVMNERIKINHTQFNKSICHALSSHSFDHLYIRSVYNGMAIT